MKDKNTTKNETFFLQRFEISEINVEQNLIVTIEELSHLLPVVNIRNKI